MSEAKSNINTTSSSYIIRKRIGQFNKANTKFKGEKIITPKKALFESTAEKNIFASPPTTFEENEPKTITKIDKGEISKPTTTKAIPRKKKLLDITIKSKK